MLNRNQYVLAAACDTFRVKLPREITAATALVESTEQRLAEVRNESAPDPYTLHAANLDDLYAAMLAWPSHDGRVAVTSKLAAVASSKRDDAWRAFAPSLFETFRPAFDEAVSRHRSGDVDALPVLHELARARDALAAECGRANLRNPSLEPITRLLAPPDRETGINRVSHGRAGAMLSAEWFDNVTRMGCVVRWMSPRDQEAHEAAIPVKIDSLHAAPVV